MPDKRPLPAEGWPALDQEGGGVPLERMNRGSSFERDEEEDILMLALQEMAANPRGQKMAMLNYHGDRDAAPNDEDGVRLERDLGSKDEEVELAKWREMVRGDY